MNNHSASSTPRIAVVEDDCDLRELTVEFLQDKGYAVWGFESAEAFYRHMATHPVDIVVLDIGLPGEDGLSVARHLRSLPDLRIIIVSASVSEADRRAGEGHAPDTRLARRELLGFLMIEQGFFGFFINIIFIVT